MRSTTAAASPAARPSAGPRSGCRSCSASSNNTARASSPCAPRVRHRIRLRGLGLGRGAPDAQHRLFYLAYRTGLEHQQPWARAYRRPVRPVRRLVPPHARPLAPERERDPVPRRLRRSRVPQPFRRLPGRPGLSHERRHWRQCRLHISGQLGHFDLQHSHETVERRTELRRSLAADGPPRIVFPPDDGSLMKTS